MLPEAVYFNYDKETQETTYNGIVYEGYTINPYYKVKSVVNKNNYEISINERTQVIGEGALSNLQNLYYIEISIFYNPFKEVTHSFF